MIGGATNNGFSSFVLVIPFIVIFFVKIKPLCHLYQILLLLFLTIVCSCLAWDKPKNILLYPYLNTEIEVMTGWAYIKTSDAMDYQLIAPSSINFWRDNIRHEENYFDDELVILKKTIHLTMERVEALHVGFSTQLKPVFLDVKGNQFTLFSEDLYEGIRLGTIKSSALENVNSLQSKGTKYFGDLMFWPLLPLFIFERFNA